ncbi:hypothetical protein O6H91_16G046400 [Diphasiastrum complanatum]|uniref:Uncharacterized protein n=2 Tax=Diphasiastrum complanatum TaxID=34168 RepID=A0ACC2BC19_DIPCM|nr:hypothetical protein O6H91_Y121900 [Diphasiastrum complanatum]KAJ7527280.1 hypothetical protein O6H91_16G046400 [Diphasiastrum complanatum]KAJ7527281.1 hypothetical protein O6H91_16G046400 [Diphasiastrum complanatum]
MTNSVTLLMPLIMLLGLCWVFWVSILGIHPTTGFQTQDAVSPRSDTIRILNIAETNALAKTAAPSFPRYQVPGRKLLASACTNKDLSISQAHESSSGIPQFVVQIVNTCLSNCAPSDIHVFCGWFASAPLVNPNVFRRIAYNDCLVNNGNPLRHGEVIRFEYANSFMYPMTFKSARFC